MPDLRQNAIQAQYLPEAALSCELQGFANFLKFHSEELHAPSVTPVGLLSQVPVRGEDGPFQHAPLSFACGSRSYQISQGRIGFSVNYALIETSFR